MNDIKDDELEEDRTEDSERPAFGNDDGGPAFPIVTNFGYVTDGMTLRDYFAAQALQGLLASHGLSLDLNFINKFAKTSYEYADAMLRAKG